MKGLVLVLEAFSPQVLGKPATGKSAGCLAFLPVGRGGELHFSLKIRFDPRSRTKG
jgi:hypothetical protein